MVAGVEASDRAKVIVEVDRRRAIARAVAEAGPEDILVIAGKGHEDYQVVGTRKLPFSDADEARAGLRARGS